MHKNEIKKNKYIWDDNERRILKKMIMEDNISDFHVFQIKVRLGNAKIHFEMSFN